MQNKSKSLVWGGSYIVEILENGKMNAFGPGNINK